MDLFPSDPPKVISACPDCGAGDVIATMSTLAGAYCQCSACGHLWHAERRKSEPEKIRGGRRRGDLAG